MALPSHEPSFLLLVLLWCLASSGISDGGEETECSDTIYIDDTSEYTFAYYPNDTYNPGISKSWCFSSATESMLLLECEHMDIPKSADCKTNALIVSSEEDDPRSYCGTNAFQASSTSNNMVVTLHSSKKSRGGQFSCRVTANDTDSVSLRSIVYENCDCGYSFKMRIVGGEETGINEFPFMVGIVDYRRGATIYCGACIISPRFVLTAEHCLTGLDLAQTVVVVGEHNISTGSETQATRVIRVKQFIHYPYYNAEARQYDIALIELASSISYSARVGPVCLPFQSRNWDLTGQSVTILGWGTIEFGGPRSKVLRKVEVDIIDITNCVDTYGENIDAYTQYCAYGEDKDACQYDSGGPLVWTNPKTNRYEIVGLVSYGRGCAAGFPSVNTKVAPFVQWILETTPTETYCYK